MSWFTRTMGKKPAHGKCNKVSEVMKGTSLDLITGTNSLSSILITLGQYFCYPFTLFIFSVLTGKRYFPYFLHTMTSNQSTERIKKYIFSFNLICISQSGKRIVKEFCQDEVSWRRSLLIRFKSWWMKSIWFYELSRLIETKFTILMMVSLKSKTSFPSKSLRPAKRSVVSANKHVVPTAHRYVIY